MARGSDRVRINPRRRFRETPRKEARAAGQLTYQGKPCPHGHSGIRHTHDAHCVECDLVCRRSRKISTRQEAKAADRLTYQGKPCPYGHSGIRRTYNGHCVECYLARPRKVSSLQEAKAAGRPTYQGKPCPHGHSGIRRTCNRHCVECDKQEKRDNVRYYMAYTYARVNRSPENQKKEKIRMRNYYIRNAAKIDARRQHRRAVNRNTLRLLYYEG